MSDASDRLRAAQNEFTESLGTLKDVVSHIATARPDTNVRVVMLNSIIVTLTSIIEESIRNIFIEYLKILNQAAKLHSHLPIKVQESNVSAILKRLKKVDGGARGGGAANLAKNLYECLNEGEEYEIIFDEIVFNDANMRSHQLTKIANEVGVSGLWEKICDSKIVEEFTGVVGVDGRVTRITAIWNDVFAERDTIVHRFSEASGWGDDKIGQSFELFEMITRRVTECLIVEAEEQLLKVSYMGK